MEIGTSSGCNFSKEESHIETIGELEEKGFVRNGYDLMITSKGEAVLNQIVSEHVDQVLTDGTNDY